MAQIKDQMKYGIDSAADAAKNATDRAASAANGAGTTTFEAVKDTARSVATHVADTAPATSRDGRYGSTLDHSIHILARIPSLPAGVFVGSLATALTEQPDLVTAHLGRQAKIGRHGFSALNSAFFADGAFVHVPRGVVVSEPLHLIFLASGNASAAYPRNLFVLGENAQATIVETYEGLGEGLGGGHSSVSFTSTVTEIVAGPGAVLDHVKVQREEVQAFHVGHFALRQDRASRIDSCSISIGAALARNDFEAVLDGEGADCILNGLYLVEGKQVVDHHMRVEHVKPHCTSHELFKGILDGKGRAVFNGLIYVHKGAQKTDAKQSNRNLLLSRDAIANSNPQLEIFADDVRCTHGSTVGQLDEAALFYLRSRGVPCDAARALLIGAFAGEVIEHLTMPALRDYATQVARRWHGEKA